MRRVWQVDFGGVEAFLWAAGAAGGRGEDLSIRLAFFLLDCYPLDHLRIIDLVRLQVDRARAEHIDLRYYDIELLNLAVALLLVVNPLKELQGRTDIPLGLKFWRKEARVLEDLVSHAQVWRDRGIFLKRQGSTLALQVVELPALHGLANPVLSDLLKEEEAHRPDVVPRASIR